MSEQEVVVRIPATTANLGPGFDALGLALDLYNEMRFKVAEQGCVLQIEGEGAGKLPTNEQNLIYRAAQRVFQKVGRTVGLQIKLSNAVPVSSGLGSSSTAVVGGMLGANALLGEPLSRVELLNLAAEMEGHPDNIAPAFLGGLVVAVLDQGSVYYHRYLLPSLPVVLVLPQFELSTQEARAVLPTLIPRTDAIFNLGRLGMLLGALQSADYALLPILMQDKLHQPYRVPLVPGMAEAMSMGRRAGAAGVVMSGAGPSLIAFAPDRHEAIGRAMRNAFMSHGLSSRVWFLHTSGVGATVEK